MPAPRTMTVLLALIILVKSLNCVIGESVFLGEPGPRFLGGMAAAHQLAETHGIAENHGLAEPIAPLQPGPAERGCTDSGCLCKGFVEPPAVTLPDPGQSLDDWNRLTALFGHQAKAIAADAGGPQRLRPGDPLFGDTASSGRELRHQHSSLTL